MADENTGLVVIDIKPEQAPVLYVPNGLEDYLNHIRELAKEVPDVTTKKGRERIGSLARSVGVSKKAIENPGRAYLKQLKELVKPAEEELKRFVDACDDISKSILKPRVEWDAEQERIAEANQMLEWHEEALEMNTAVDKAMAERFESDHEMALLMNVAFDRAQADKKAEDERLQKERDDRIAAEAAAKVKQDADLAAQQEREASARREAELKLQAEQAERDRVASVLKAEQDKKDAIAKAEREKQEAIAAEQRKAQEEADRIKREAQQKEDARLAEEKRVADEAAARAANVEHRRTINQQAVADLVAAGIPEECAVQCVKAIAKGQVSAIAITY
ncbi:TPA: hypothetical protein ACX4EX_001616 [Yersinia enterocolitica]|uniref:hypothetical protein n=1 Tax=Yersinia enterocolitica TaxID=630 RepID=UPI0005FD0986|nr:hypothetical protein [Yersinia enterocolitica]EKN5933457.1 hypothetical protein [Yersinia enterocolitica]CRE93667.1 Uncharacterised protein [Yersinia enterocolitica]HDL7350177.1 hypothetical protein [Yersinia enterocolitica]